ncbi:GtrA family protein [Vibrio hippocampi]|uniref:GtrA/DPMS transmembrane domain-containing protein n=1 Tax=Vibrio hippocampi TaxID=654686 RepID=A0ABM8ZJY9_9VIBR|nr:GtrA family protein [Vibrio hippocampi]CAH0527247.1 hypothetical protein VHP8226_02575 [Vibrio hippocampi]
MTSWRDKLLAIRIVRFGLVGGIATAIHLSVAFAFLYLIKDSVLLANILGFCLAFVFSYFAQTKLVFQRQLNLHNALRFFMVQFGALMLSQASSALLTHSNSYLKVLFVVIILPIITYLIHRFWTFAQPSKI